jgi:Dolichyl-phosphate-mannose-protein mannosyltransferase
MRTFIYAAACIVVLVLGLSLRARSALNDLWMDEIWSIELVRELHSPIEVFTKTHHDNNHYLNSLFIYFLGQRGNWPGYRIPAVVAGFGSILLAWLIGRRTDKATAFFSMFLVGLSYVMILYSSEARGYAPLIFFCFLCFLILQSFLDRPRWHTAALFSICAILGFTSHLTFLTFFLSSLVWFEIRLRRRGFPVWSMLRWSAACYAVPLAFVAALYFVDLRHLQIGGGTPIGVLNGYAATLAWSLGGPNIPWLQMISGIICVIVLIAALAVVLRRREDEWIFFIAVIAVMPLALSFFQHGTLHYVRYFVVALAFMLLLFGRLLGWLYNREAVGKIVCAISCLLFITLNGWDIAALLKYGRGHISEAVQFMVDHSVQKSPVTFGGEQDFRILFVLAFYSRETMPNQPMQYYEHDQWPANGPEWVIFHKESFEQPVPPGKTFSDKSGNWFELVRTFPTAPLSGVHWFIYHRIAQRS